MDDQIEELELEPYKDRLKEIIRNYLGEKGDLEIVPSVAERAKEINIDEDNAFRLAMAVTRSDGKMIVLINSIVSDDNRNSVLPTTQILNKISDIYQKVDTLEKFLIFTLLHEIAHLKLHVNSNKEHRVKETEADQWAYNELDKWLT